MSKFPKRVLMIVFIIFVLLTLIYVCVFPLFMSIYFETRLQGELPRIQAVLDKQCIQRVEVSRAGFRVDDTGTTWSGQNQSGLNVSCRLYEYSNEWECSC